MQATMRCLCICVLAASVAAVPGNSPFLRFVGRHNQSKSNQTSFDWIGSGVEIKIVGSSGVASVGGTSAVVVDLDALGGTRFSVYRREAKIGSKRVHLKDFFSGDGRGKVTLAEVSDGCESTISLIKTSEPVTSTMTDQRVITLYGLDVMGTARVQLAKFTASDVPSRRLDVYGDSDSASYGIDSNADSFQCNWNQSKQENFAHGWVTHVADQLNADFHVQAVSGVGVAQNALDGIACSTSITLPNLIKRTLQSVSEDDYNATADIVSWGMPGAIVVYVGSNDYVNLFPPTKAKFSEKYDGMVRSILQPWMNTRGPTPDSLPAVVHICGGEATPCDYIKGVVAAHNRKGLWKSVYTETGDKGGKKGGCAGHRNTTQQAALAARLAPIIAKAVGWASESMLGAVTVV